MRRALVVFGVSLLTVTALHTQSSPPATGFGARCSAGQFSFSGFLLVCSEAGTFRYALASDVPPESGGYVARPAWYPRLSEIFRATNAPACPLSGRVTFTSPMIRPEDLLPIAPQGLMTSDHVTPIDHGYIATRPLSKRRTDRTDDDYIPVFAPADAEVIEVSSLGAPNSIRVVLAHGCETYSVFMVINRLSGALGYLQDDLQARQFLMPHVRLLAGEEFAEQRDNPIDFSVHVGASWLAGFASPFSYAEGEAWKPYTIDPWPFFAPDLAELFEGSMQRLAPPRWGRIDQDVPGTAAGNWFLDGTVGYSGRTVESLRSATEPVSGGPIAGKATYAWSHLALARHAVQPDRWLLSIGWWKDDRGDPVQYLIENPTGLDPSQLTSAAGATVYRLWRWTMNPGPINDAYLPIGYDVVPTLIEGLAALRVNSDGTLTIEVLPGVRDPAQFTGFTAAQRLYRR